MKNKDLTHKFNQIRNNVGDVGKPKITCNTPYMTINF